MNARSLAATMLATALVPLGVLGLTTDADAASTSRITVATSDTSVSSGEQLVLTGRLSSPGVVRVLSLGDGRATPLTGAVVHTRSDGTYRVRVVLSRTGDRVLRVVGNPDASGVADSRARVAIRVG